MNRKVWTSFILVGISMMIFTSCGVKSQFRALAPEAAHQDPDFSPTSPTVIRLREKLLQQDLQSPVDGTPALARFPDIDPTHKVPARPLNLALGYYEKLRAEIKNPRFLTIVDFNQFSSLHRMYLVDMTTGAVETFQVAHGEASDPGNIGYPQFFSNIVDSHMSSIGVYYINEEYASQTVGRAARLDGLEDSNTNARILGIVLHGSMYVNHQRSPIGRSWGCPAVDRSQLDTLLERVKDGSLLYLWYNQ
jgi:hypothetical protein